MAKDLIKSDATVKAAKPKAAPYRLFDGDGLYLLIRPDGKRWWRLDYTVAGKRKTVSLGVYPSTGLSLARSKAARERALVADGVDPSAARKVAKVAKVKQAEANEAERRTAEGVPLVGSFEAVAREWYAKRAPGWVASHGDKIIRRLERDVFPWLGARSISDIKPPELLAALRRIEARGVTPHPATGAVAPLIGYPAFRGRVFHAGSLDILLRDGWTHLWELQCPSGLYPPEWQRPST